MSKPTFDEASEAYLQYMWMLHILEKYDDSLEIEIEVENEDEEENETTSATFKIEKKADNKSSISMETEAREITLYWDGTRLSATVYDNENDDSDKMEVPEALSTMVSILKEYLGITDDATTDAIDDVEHEISTDTDDEDDEDIEEEDPTPDKEDTAIEEEYDD